MFVENSFPPILEALPDVCYANKSSDYHELVG